MSKYDCLYSCQCGALCIGYYMASDKADENIRALVKSKVKCPKCGRFALLKDVVKHDDDIHISGAGIHQMGIS